MLSRSSLNRFLALLSLPAAILLWWWLSRLLGPHRLPSPFTIAAEIYPTLFASRKLAMSGAGDSGFFPHILATTGKVMLGTTLGVCSGLALGLLMRWFGWLYHLLRLVIDALRAVPPLAFVPLLLMILGRSLLTQILSLSIYSFFLVVINTLNAIDNVPPIYVKFARTLGASRFRVFRTVIFPAIVPELVGGIRVAIITGWGLQVIIEMMGANSGIGKIFALTANLNALDLMLVGIFWVVVLAGAMDIVFVLAARHVTRWRKRAVKAGKRAKAN